MNINRINSEMKNKWAEFTNREAKISNFNTPISG